jgi:hypothetical protein
MSLYSPEAPGSMEVPSDGLEEEASALEAEAWVLATDAGQRLLDDVAGIATPGPADVARWRRRVPAPAVAAAIRLSSSRARARAKFSQGDRMWLDPVGLEQATAEVVARHKAARFNGPVIVDLCAGIGGDSLALARRADVLAVDLDHGMCRRIAWNAAVYEVADRILPCHARAEFFPVSRGTWVHVDPDRRATGSHRVRSVVDYAPGLDFLRGLIARAPAGAIKLSPASDFAQSFAGEEYEIELISLGGECKEATVWFGAAASCRRRATRLPENVTWTDRDGDCSDLFRVAVLPISTYVYDPDPALLRSGLLDSFAAAHGLNRISADVDYLAGDRLVATPFLSAFKVQSVHRLDVKRLRALVAELSLGPLEIKIRGINLRAEDLRSRLRPRGDRSATLIIAGGSGPAQAVIAVRVPAISPRHETHPPESTGTTTMQCLKEAL